jgi:hypothetical protein
MKTRHGFVANSSSSSFCIYGAIVSRDDDDIYEKAEDHGLECRCPSDDYYIGLSWSDVKDDETGAQFKERVRELIEKAFPGETFELGTHEEAWMS